MTGRAGAVATSFASTVLLALVLLGAFQLLLGADPVSAFFDAGPRLLVIGGGLALVLWLAALLLVAFRIRPATRGRRVALDLATLAGAAVIDVVAVTAFALVQGGWSAFFIVFALEAVVALVIAGTAAVLLTQFLLVRPAPAPADPVPTA